MGPHAERPRFPGPLLRPWAAAHQASLSFTISWTLLKLMPIESVMPSSHLILCRPLLLPLWCLEEGHGIALQAMQELQEMQFGSLGWEAPLEEGTATHSSILGLPWWLR